MCHGVTHTYARWTDVPFSECKAIYCIIHTAFLYRHHSQIISTTVNTCSAHYFLGLYCSKRNWIFILPAQYALDSSPKRPAVCTTIDLAGPLPTLLTPMTVMLYRVCGERPVNENCVAPVEKEGLPFKVRLYRMMAPFWSRQSISSHLTEMPFSVTSVAWRLLGAPVGAAIVHGVVN